MEDYYKAKIMHNMKYDGISANSALHGEEIKIITKLFITSLDENFNHIANSMLLPFLNYDIGANLNNLLIIIKPNDDAYVYTNFPFGTSVIPKTSLKKYQLVYKKDYTDITGVFFKDDFIDLNPKEDDRIIWLFRIDWLFGLYFNLTKKVDTKNILNELGFCYKRLHYYSEYNFIENADYFNLMISDGWFPFIEIINNGLEFIKNYYKNNKKNYADIQLLINSFNVERINCMINRWWFNDIFKRKKQIITAGINCYLKDTPDEMINCIKNLSTELEGILRIAYFNEFKKDPNTREFKDFITSKGQSKFNHYASISFPNKFLDYLDQYIFKGFNYSAGDISESRHCVAHGIADDSHYNKEFALKIILTLDNIYHFLK